MTMVEARPWRSSMISSRSRRCSAVKRREAPVVEDEQLDAGEALEQAGMASVAAGERQRLEQPRHALVEDGAVVAAGLVPEGAGDPGFADAGRAGDQQILVAVDPIAGGELLEQGAVEAAGGAQIDILDRRRSGAGWRTCRRVTRRLLSRSVASRSTSSPRRSSKPSAAMSGWRRCSSNALAMPASRSAIRRSWVGWLSIVLSLRQW